MTQTREERAAYYRAWRAARTPEQRESDKRVSSAWYYAHRETELAERKIRYASDPGLVRDQVRAYRSKNRQKVLDAGRKSRGLPKPTRPESAICECCGSPPQQNRSLALDHCHVSGQFRGWLCFTCNRGIGQMGDSIDGLMKAVRYLERAAKQEEISNG